MRNTFIILCYVLFLGNTLSGQADSKSQFEQASATLESKEYHKAIKAFNELYNQDYRSPELFVNLANAYYNSDNLAKAIITLERGLKYYPNNKSIKDRLNIASSKVQTEIFEVDDFFLLRFWKAFSQIFGVTMWGVLQILTLLLTLFGFYQWMIKSDAPSRRKGFIISIVGILLFLIAFGAGQTVYHLRMAKDAGVVLDETELHEGPDERSGSSTVLSNGVKVKIIDEIGDWYKVQLLNQEVGYLEKTIIEII